VKEKDPLLDVSQKARILKENRHLDLGEIAQVVDVTLPGIIHDDKTLPATTIKCMVTADRVRKVAMEVTEESLTYVRLAIKESHDNGKVSPSKKRSTPLRDVKGIKPDKRRKVVYTFVADPETGSSRRVQLKPESWQEPFIQQAAQLLKDRIDNDLLVEGASAEVCNDVVEDDTDASQDDQ
jgi:hypothetical protein